MEVAQGGEDHRVRRRIAAAFIVLGLLASIGAGVLVHGAVIRIPRLNAQADAAREAQFHASSIARHINYILAETAEESFADAAELDRRLELLDGEILALVQLRRAEATSLGPVREAAGRLAREPSPAALEQLRTIRLQLDELIEEAGVEAQEVSDRVEGSTRTVVFGAGLAGLAYVLLLAGASVYVLGIVRRQQEAIAGYVERLEDRNSDLEAFAGRVAHDLRGPLTPLAMSAELIHRKAEDADEVRRLAVRVRRASVGAQRLIDSLLAFSTTGRSPAPEAGARVDHCLAGAVEDQRDVIDEREIEVGQALEEITAFIDPALLRTVFYNLVSNAVRYLPVEGPRRIEVRCWAEADVAVAEVEDSGAGIPPAARHAVFEPFVRSSAVPGGVGLGLATVKRIVEAHGGRVTLGDGRLGGTCVRIRLPGAAIGRAAAAAVSPGEQRPPA
jgi:signal transduction histidine kinase